MEGTLANVRHLYALAEVSTHRRINLAADKVNLSQPAVTQAISKIEQQLGLPLFDRRSEGMFATEAGALYLRRVDRALSQLREGERQARRKSAKTGRRGFHALATAVQLRALVAVARTGNFSHAAHHLGVSQPGVHRAARDLERLSELTLFEPLRRGVAMTPAGEVLARHVRLAAAEIEQGRFELSEYLGRDSTRIAVGAMPLSRTSLLPAAIDSLLSTSDGHLQVQCVDGPYDMLLRDLRFGDLDFLIGALRPSLGQTDLVQEKLFEDRLYVVAARDHPLANKSGLTLEDTLSYPWVAPPKNTPSGSYLFNSLQIQKRPQTPIRIVASSMVLVRGLMMRGDYVTVMSEHQIAVEQQSGFLAPLPIALLDSLRDIGLTYRSGWEPTPTQNRFLDLVRHVAVSAGN